MKTITLTALAAVVAAAITAGSAMAASDAETSATLFNKKCGTCHSGEAGKNKLGPSLFGIIGKKAGTNKDFTKYKALVGSDIVWSEENLDKFIANPREFVKGTSMSGNISEARDRASIIAHLKTFK